MRKHLLLLILCLIATTTLSIAQSAPDLGKATVFAVLGSSYVSNTGNTGVSGDLGVTSQGLYTDNGQLLIRGTKYIGGTLPSEALQDARAVFDYYSDMSVASFTGPELVANGSSPGIYRNNGNVDLDGIIVLNANGDVNARFVFIIDGDLTTPSIAPPAPGTGLLLQNGAQPQNIYWIVKGNVHLGNSTSFQGNIISLGDITLDPGVNLIGRAISLNGGVSLNTNNIFLPSVILADLKVEKSAAAGEYLIGDEVTYTITVLNTGPSTAYGVVVSEITPTELEFVRVESASAGTYDPATKEWHIGVLQLNETAELKLTFKVVSGGDIVNKITVGSNNPDPKPGDNEDEDPVVVPVIAADLSIVKEASAGPHVVGGNITYTIEVKNKGPYTAENVVVNELLPAELELQSFTVSKGSYDPGTGIFTVGSLAKGETATLTITAKILAAGEITNTAGVGSSTPDPNPGDNTDIVVVNPTCPAPALSLAGGASQCAETANVTYTVTEVFGATYAFELTGGLTEVSRSGNSITVNVGAASGTVRAIVTDLCGNSYTVTKEVKVTTKPEAPTIGGSASVCANSTGSYTAEGPGTSFEWTADGDIQILSGQNSKTVEVSVGANGGTLTVKASNECFTSEAASIAISTTTPPVAPASITGPATLCLGNEATYTITPVDGADGYTWTVPEGWEIISGQGTGSITVRAGSASGDVSVIAENECGASSATAQGVTVNTVPPTPGAVSGPADACESKEGFTYTINPVDGATGYIWTVPAGWTIVSGQGTTSITVTSGTAGGGITVKAENECGSSTAAEMPVTVSKAPETPVAINGDASGCIGSSLTFSAGTAGAEGYTWTVPAGWTITSGQGTGTITVTVGNGSGDVTVSATNKCGASSSVSKAVSSVTPPVAPASITGPTELCLGNEASYNIPAVSGATGYTWTVPEGWEIISGQGTGSIRVRTGSASGDVSVIAENNCGASSGTAVGVTVNDKPQTPGAISGTADACEGVAGFTYTINPVDGATGYIWTVPAGWTITSGQGTASITVTSGTAGGGITVKAENECGSSAAAEMPVTVSKTPEAPVAISGSASGCVGSSLTFSAGTAGAESYNWTVPAGWTITSGQGTGSITVTVGSAPGNISVTATNKCGTSSGVSKAVEVTTPPVAPGAISGPSATCGGTSSLTYSIAAVAGATGYTWTVPTGWTIESGQGTTEIKVTAGTGSGDVTVTADNTCGSSSAAIYTTSVNNVPPAPVTINGSSNGCIGTVLTYSVGTVDGATGYNWTVPSTWTIKSGQGTGTIEVEVGSGAGMITVSGTNECGTGATASIAVSPTKAPNAPGAIEGPDASCANSENLVYSITVLTGGEKYNWTVPDGWTIVSGQGTYSITVNAGAAGGEVSVTASNDCGTSPASSLSVDITTPPVAATRINDLSSLCGGLMYSVDPVPGSTSYTWTVPAGFTIISGQGTPNITVKVDNTSAFGDVSVVANNGECSSPTTSLQIDKSVLDGGLEFPKAFSPNGDGINDTWVIGNLSKYPKNQVVVFNRWGSEVYKKENYQNDWNGNSLGQGTYYYIIKVTMCDGVMKEFTGYVTIFR